MNRLVWVALALFTAACGSDAGGGTNNTEPESFSPKAIFAGSCTSIPAGGPGANCFGVVANTSSTVPDPRVAFQKYTCVGGTYSQSTCGGAACGCCVERTPSSAEGATVATMTCNNDAAAADCGTWSNACKGPGLTFYAQPPAASSL